MKRIIGIILVTLLASSSAFGQFLVNPMRIEQQVRAGRQFWAQVTINNTQLDRAQRVDLRLVDLTQGSSGGWKRIEVDDPNADASELRSCRSWLTLEKEFVTLPPGQITPVRIRINVPRGTWGYYMAAIIASMPPREGGEEGMTAGMGLEFLIPVILDTRGRALRNDVKLGDVGLRFQRQSEKTLPASLVSLTIQNEGMSFSRLEAVVRISKTMHGHMRRITEVKIPSEGDLGIVPGVTLNLTQDVGRALPAGEYFLEAFLGVDGRRADRVEKHLSFEGDLRLPGTAINADAALDLDPLEAVIESPPGQMRLKNVLVFNASEETVTVDARAVLPEHLVARALPIGDRAIRGEELGCADWVAFRPSQFTLKGYARQYVQIQCRTPEAAAALPEHYALIKLHARYPDGQEGGTTTGYLYVDNTRAQTSPSTDVLQLTLSEAMPSRYIIAARCLNNGNARVMPRCRALVRTYPEEAERGSRIELTSEVYEQTGTWLPMDYRTFQGVLDVSNLALGMYRLVVVLENSQNGQGGSSNRQKAFEVVEENGIKVIEERGLDDIGGAVPVRL